MKDFSVNTKSVPPAEPWPQGGLESVDKCPICGNSAREILHEELDDQVFFCAPGMWTLYRCTACGSGYLDPRPTAETIGLAYRQYFTHAPSTRLAYEDLSAVRRLRRALANGYRNARFGTDHQPSSSLGVWLLRLLPRQRETLDSEARHLRRAVPGATLLDVGCGNGEFLDLAAKLGWKVEGIDFDPQAVEVARQRGLVVHRGGINTLDDRAEYYDVITLSHVIEHVHDPLGLLRGCFRLLKPSGRLWLETPNLESTGHTYYGCHWQDLDPPRHLILFTWGSLDSALAQVGFIRVTPLSPRPLAYQIFSASEAIARRRDSFWKARNSIAIRWRAWSADLVAKSSLTSREFITISALKPQSR